MTPYPTKDFGSHFSRCSANKIFAYTSVLQQVRSLRGNFMNSTDKLQLGTVLSFHKGVARQCGLNAAIVFNHIVYWLDMNASNKEAQRDGKVWMYETQEKMSEFFEFLSVREIQNALKILIEEGLIIREHFNNNHFVRTNWYTVYDQELIRNSTIKKVYSKPPAGVLVSPPPVSSEDTRQCHVYKEEDKQEDKKIQIPAAEPVVVSLHLKDLKIPDTLKMQLTKNHDESYLELLAKRCLRWKGRTDDVAAIKFIQGKWDDWNDFIPADEQRELNLEYLNSLRHLDLKVIAHNKIDVGADYIEFSTNMNVDAFDISNKTFIAEVKEHIARLKQLEKNARA